MSMFFEVINAKIARIYFICSRDVVDFGNCIVSKNFMRVQKVRR